MPASLPPRAAQHFQAAQAAQQSGRLDQALVELRSAVEAAPDHPLVLNGLAVRHLADGRPAEAAPLLERATAADPKAPELWLNLARARRETGDRAAERQALDRALACDRRHFGARVRSAEWHEAAGDRTKAAADWSAVLQMGSALPPEQARRAAPLLDRAQAAFTAWSEEFARAVDEGLADLRHDLDAEERRRFEVCVDATLGRRRIYHPEPFGLHFPFLPAEEFFPRRLFPFLEELERHTDAIKAEAEALLAEGGDGFAPYVANPPGTPPDKWSELDHSTRWSALFLYRYGKPDEAALKRFPATARALECVPRADIPGRAPTAFFSLLKPGTRIPPHTGVTNARAIVHLPLIVPGGCSFRVGGETREWKVGEAFVFDDTIEHEARNDSDQPRVVLIIDVWNPYLTEGEKALLRALFASASAHGLELEAFE